MRQMTLAAAAALTLSGAALASAMPTAPKITDPAFQTEVLNAHNAERRAVGVADLVWDASLAQEAQEWATGLASSGAMQHASQRTHGENLYMNAAGRSTVTQMIGGWLAERKNYIPGAAHPNVSKTGNWADVGHYTAMVWSTTTAVGCAVARGARSDFLVCRYNPPANMRGRVAYDASKPRREIAVAAAPVPAPVPAKVPAAQAAPVPAAASVAAPTPAPAKVIYIPVPVPVAKPATLGQ